MKKLVLFLLAAGLLLGLGAGHAAAQSAPTSTFSGKAVRWDGTAISGAIVAVLRGPLETDAEVAHTATAADGSWTLTVPAGGPYWLHIRTFGTWWGYSYYIPFTVRPGEAVSQIYFALGPRDVKDVISLPAPISNVGPETGSDATPVPAQPTATPVSNVKPIVGVGDEPAPPQHPKPAPHPAPLPATGSDGQALGLWTLLALVGLTLVGLGTSLRLARRRR
jgi:hypothetical protein